MLNRFKGSLVPPMVLLAVTAAFLYATRPAKSSAVDFARIPSQFPGWRGQDVEADPTSVEILQPDGMLTRRYEDGRGRPAWLCIVYHENNKYGAHDVPVCYTSQGYAKKALARETVPVAGGNLTVNRLLAGKVGDTRVIYYWFAIGGRYFADAGEFRKAQMISGLVRNRSAGALVRLEIGVDGEDVAKADTRLKDLTRRVAADLPLAFGAHAATSQISSQD
jgi:EpsI family protein